MVQGHDMDISISALAYYPRAWAFWAQVGRHSAGGTLLSRSFRLLAITPRRLLRLWLETRKGRGDCMRGVSRTFLVCEPMKVRGLEMEKKMKKYIWHYFFRESLKTHTHTQSHLFICVLFSQLDWHFFMDKAFFVASPIIPSLAWGIELLRSMLSKLKFYKWT